VRRPTLRVAGALLAVAALGASCGGSPSGVETPSPGHTPTPASSSAPTAIDSGPVLPGLSTGPAPWPPEMRHLAERLRALGLPPLGPEVTRVHIHQDLEVFVHGQQVRVPFGIGIDLQRLKLAEIHTHGNQGTIHIEASRPRRFTLGMVFDVWGVRFSRDCLGAYCTDADNRIRVFVNGQQYAGDPAGLPLHDLDVIVVAYGTADEVPRPLPVKFQYELPPLPP
jgi:hypothetical protein